MARPSIIVALVMATTISLVAGCSTGKDTSGNTPTSAEPAYAKKLRSAIVQVMRQNAIPGAVVFIRSRPEGKWTATFGTSVYGDKKPLTTADHFRIGGITASMTSTVVLQLAQERRVSLEDPISRYRAGVPNGDQIALRQLLEMRSGLHSYTDDVGFTEAIDKDPAKTWTPEELLNIAFSHPNDFPPGKKYAFSNTNTILLGLVIEKVTGKSAAEMLDSRIFRPLNLKNTYLPAANDSSIPDPHPQGYQFGTNASTVDTYALPEPQRSDAVSGKLIPLNETNANPSWAWTSGAGISTVGDLAIYVKSLVGGGMVNQQMQEARLRTIWPIDARNGYGLGIAKFGPHLYGHDGQIPGYSTLIGWDPDKDLTIVIATNLSAVPSGINSALTLLNVIAPQFYGRDWATTASTGSGSSTAPAPTR